MRDHYDSEIAYIFFFLFNHNSIELTFQIATDLKVIRTLEMSSLFRQ